MEWLETGLAFAVTMMVFSTMVSVIVETGHRILRIREKGLQRLMATLYEDVIWPRLSNQLGQKKATVKDFVTGMTSTRFLPVESDVAGLKSYFHKVVNAKDLKSLTTLEFIERLPETAAGRGLVAEARKRGRQYLETFLKDLASKYEDFGENASEYFARRARLVSVVVAIGLAFSLNINAIRLIETFLVNREVRQAMIKQGETVAANLQKQETALQQFIKTRGEEEVKNLEEIEKNIQELNQTVQTLSSIGIPIGWSTVIWKRPVWAEKKDIDSPTLRSLAYAWLLLLWTGSVLLTGFLIGLGGPFWFNTFRKLSALTGMVRGFQTPVQKEKEQELEPRAKPGEESDQKPKVVAIFETAAKARALSDVRGRVLLTPEGNIDQGGIL